MKDSIHVNHVGFLCDARKEALITTTTATHFQVEDLAQNASESLSGYETFKVVFEGPVAWHTFAMGEYGICDFSALRTPGLYRISLTNTSDALSFQFVIADGAFHQLPNAFLRFIKELRSGPYSSFLRGPTHMDDAKRSDTGAAMDLVGGWYDAGDTRKWMAHSTLAAWGFLEVQERLHLFENSELMDEITWGLNILPKMQDPATGMIFEDVGGGGSARMKPGDSWWYENHGGCGADNSDNRFTDNIPGSGDERSVRVHYSPFVQYTSYSMLARGAAVLQSEDPDTAGHWRTCAEAIEVFMADHKTDSFHEWTAVRAWEGLAAIQGYRAGWKQKSDTTPAIEWLLDQFDHEMGFWRASSTDNEPHRGIIHAAQPIIALAEFVRSFPESKLAARSREVLSVMLDRYALVMAGTNPFGFIPFGCYKDESVTPGDTYTRAPNGWLYRNCMPVHHPMRTNHGLSGHWMTWAYALALTGDLLDDPRAKDLAWKQMYWLLGHNHRDVSFISGVGYNNPMPHSRFLGTLYGGFMNGFCGTEEDIPFVDTERRCDWRSTEYWNTPLAYCLLTLSILLPGEVKESRKLGKKLMPFNG